MYFQEKSCYDSCCVPAFIKQLVRHIYYVIIGHVKALKFVFSTTQCFTVNSSFIFTYKHKDYLMRKKGLMNRELI